MLREWFTPRGRFTPKEWFTQKGWFTPRGRFSPRGWFSPRDWLTPLEIRFWRAWVDYVHYLSPLRSQLRWKPVLLSASIGLVLLALTTTSFVFYRIGRGLEQQEPRPAAQFVRPVSDQTNVLVLMVDRLGARARLEGAWLVIYDPTPKLTYLPLFPARDGVALSEAFRLESSGRPAAEFEAILQRNRLWWDHYLVLDRALMLSLLRLGRVSLPTAEPDEIARDPLVSLGVEEGQFPLRAQAEVLKALCHSGRLFNQVQPAILAALLQADQRTDLEREQIKDGLQTIFQSRLTPGTPQCEFPTMTGGYQP